jgi:hypothetical protein
MADQLNPAIVPTEEQAVASRVANFSTAEPMPGLAGTHVDTPDDLDVARATWSRETIVGNLLRHYAIDSSIEGDDSLKADWNPYSYYARHRDELADLEGNIGNGDFDYVRSEVDFRKRAEFIRQSRDDLQTMQRGGFLGQALGMGVSLLDVTTLIPGGVYGSVLKGGRVANAARLGGVMALEQGLQETALHGLDPSRTAEESFLNIGTATFLGAGLGSLVKHVHPNHPLNPGHPNNPLDPANFSRDTEVIEHRIGQTPDEGTRVGGSVGAMEANVEAAGFAEGSGAGAKVLRAAEAAMGHGTPLGRMRGYTGPGFEALAQLVDMGGRLTKAMTRGVAPTTDAESLRVIYTQHARDAQEDIRRIFRQAQIDMGQSALETGSKTALSTVTLGAVDRNAIPRDLFFSGVHQRMSADMLEGNGYSGQRQAAEQVFKQQLVQRGYTDAQAAQVWKRVDEAAGRTKELFDRFFGDAVKTGLIDPADAPKGSYGLPVMYVRSAINERPRDMENAVLRLLADKPADDWLAEKGFPAWAELQKDPQAANDALRTWRGESEDAALTMAANNLATAQTALKRSQDEFDVIERFGMPEANRERKLRSVSAMKAQVRSAEADHYARSMAWHLNRIEKAETRLAEIERHYPDLDRLGDDVQAEFAKTGERIDRTIAGFPVVLERRATLAEQLADLKAQRQEAKVAKDPEEMLRIRGEREALIAERMKVTRELNDLRAKLDEVARGQRKAWRWVEAVANKVEEVRASKELAADRPGVQHMLDDSAERVASLKAKASEAEQARRWAVEQWLQVRKGRQISRSEVRAAGKDARKAAATLKRLKARTPLVEYAEGLVSSLRGQERAPRGLMMDEVPETGRIKERKFQWTPELWRELSQKGMVETDPVTLLDRYARDMGGRLAVHKAMNGKSREAVLREVREHYDAKIASARSDKTADKLRAAQADNLADIETSWNRVLGHSDIEDDNAVTWFAEKLRQTGFIRMAGGFIFAAVGDLGTAMFAAPGFIRGIRKQHTAFKQLIELAEKGETSARELRAMLASMESGAHMATSINALGGGSSRAALGFGTGATRRMTAQVDRVLNMTADKVNVLSGLQMFSDSVRRTAGLVQLDNIVRWVGDYANIGKSKQMDLASLGIGAVEAKRLDELFKAHGERVGELFNPGISKWRKADDGDAMADVLNAALVKTQNRASYTQGFGNMPRLMDKTIGKLFFQFQSFAFQFTNNFVLTGLQRGAVSGDWLRFAHVLGVAMSAAVFVSTARAQLRGDDPSQWSNAKWAKELVDRSGILGWLSPYVDGATKLIGPTVNNVAGVNLFEASSRYRENGALESFLGPWAAQLKHLSGMAGDGARHDWEAMREKAARLVPLNQQINALRYIAEGIQGD